MNHTHFLKPPLKEPVLLHVSSREHVHSLIHVPTHRIHGTGICTYILLIFMVDVDVGKYTIKWILYKLIHSLQVLLENFRDPIPGPRL